MPLRATLHFTRRSIVMEGLSPLYPRVAGIDVHRMLHVVTVLIERADGSIEKSIREFSTSSAIAVPWPNGWPGCKCNWW